MATIKAKPERERKPKGRPVHVPTPQSRTLVRALIAVGYSHSVISSHLNIAPGTLRQHYRVELDHAVEQLCANAMARMVAISSRNGGMAGVKASMWILAVKAGLVEKTRIELEPVGPGIGGLMRFVEKARAAKARREQNDADDLADAAEDTLYETHMPPAPARH